MDGLDRVQDLVAEPQRGRQGEGAARLRAPQLGQVAALQLHHHVVEAVVPAAADEATHVVSACNQRRRHSRSETAHSRLWSLLNAELVTHLHWQWRAAFNFY